MERFVAILIDQDSWEWYIFDDMNENIIAGPMNQILAINLAEQLNEGLL